MIRRIALILQAGACGAFLFLAFWHWPKVEALARPEGQLSPESAYRLPPSAYRVAWDLTKVPTRARAGAPVVATVSITNLSGSPWPVFPYTRTNPPGAYCIRLSYRWWDADREKIVGDYETRTNLPQILEPSQTAAMTLNVAAPKEPGHYVLQFDLCQEMVTWFEQMGASKALVEVQVQR